MKRSAGILPYKIVDGEVFVYLEHPGGPYYKNVDRWSVCKGECDDELAIDAAVREFYEEAGVRVNKEELKYLASHKVSHHKLVVMFYVNIDIDPNKIKSNTFVIEYPRGSGIKKEFPEMDKACWFNIHDAKEKIVPSQLFFIERLDRKVREK